MNHTETRQLPVQEVAADAFGVGPWGRTRTAVDFVRCGPSWVLIDAGWSGDGPSIEQAARRVFGSTPPAAILLTHCHPDHAGAADGWHRSGGCRVHIHALELPIERGEFAAMRAVAGPLDRWMILPIMRAVGPR